MIQSSCVGALDQGTTGTRFIVFDSSGRRISSAYREHDGIYPQPGWVEHDPGEIWENVKKVVRQGLEDGGLTGEDLIGIGVTNQRETVLAWDEEGRPLANAIVWQDRRTSRRCEELRCSGKAQLIKDKTGLKLDPYFSGTKLEWLMGNVPGLEEKARRGEALFGTMESFLIWKMTGGKHLTDFSNASRTLLFDIENLQWDEELLDIFDVPRRALPEPVENVGAFGEIETIEELQGVPIGAAFGDQQAALFGQGCLRPGEAKNTYGTGSFLLLNVGETPVFSEDLLTTVAFSLNGEVKYALEGSIYSTGATVQWLRDELGLLEDASQSEELAIQAEDNGGVYLVPAFTGLGAPHWDSQARGLIIGLTRGSGRKQLVRAGLESIAYQVEEVLRSMKDQSPIELEELRVDGGASENSFLCQFQSDISSMPVVNMEMKEATALGAAYGAGLELGLWQDVEDIERVAGERKGETFLPRMKARRRKELFSEWERAVKRAKGWARDED